MARAMGHAWFGSKAMSGLCQALIALMPPHAVLHGDASGRRGAHAAQAGGAAQHRHRPGRSRTVAVRVRVSGGAGAGKVATNVTRSVSPSGTLARNGVHIDLILGAGPLWTTPAVAARESRRGHESAPAGSQGSGELLTLARSPEVGGSGGIGTRPVSMYDVYEGIGHSYRAGLPPTECRTPASSTRSKSFAACGRASSSDTPSSRTRSVLIKARISRSLIGPRALVCTATCTPVAAKLPTAPVRSS